MALEKVIQVVSDHPAPVAIGVLLLLLFLKSNSSGAQPATATNYNYLAQARATDSQTNVALATINAQASSERAKYASANYIASITTQAELAKQDSASIIQGYLGSLASSTNKQLSNNNLIAQRDSNASAITLASKQADTAIQLAQLSADATNNITNKNYDLQSRSLNLASQNLPLILSNNQALAQIQAGSAAQLAQIASNTAIQTVTLNTSAARTTADQAARTSKQNNITKGVGDVLKIGASLFGF